MKSSRYSVTPPTRDEVAAAIRAILGLTVQAAEAGGPDAPRLSDAGDLLGEALSMLAPPPPSPVLASVRELLLSAASFVGIEAFVGAWWRNWDTRPADLQAIADLLGNAVDVELLYVVRGWAEKVDRMPRRYHARLALEDVPQLLAAVRRHKEDDSPIQWPGRASTKGPTSYQQYLASEDWQRRRLERLRIDDFQCVRCGSRRRLQVHHLTYERVGAEDVVNDLVTLCRKCHAHVEGKPEPGESA